MLKESVWPVFSIIKKVQFLIRPSRPLRASEEALVHPWAAEGRLCLPRSLHTQVCFSRFFLSVCVCVRVFWSVNNITNAPLTPKTFAHFGVISSKELRLITTVIGRNSNLLHVLWIWTFRLFTYYA